ncbi:MAG: 50S ribosomal protein L24 [Deltaproteobacteria bacterium]|nr:50S ribosomal protein L24 [Deltaproteobacteria bacterium]MBI3391058.1 50S ribosomal protein L24 [Deltaproteobacteria bacterium]
MRAQIRKNDTVMIIAGKERGKTGKVLRVLPERERVVIERLNLVKRHSKGRGPQSPQGIIEKEAPLHRSNVMIMCDKCNAPVRMGKKTLQDGHNIRVCRRCGDQLDR